MKLLWVKTDLLHPLDKGGRIRTFNMIKEIGKMHKVTYVCFADPHKENKAIKQLQEHVETVIIVPKKETERFSVSFYLKIFCSLFSRFPYTIKNYYSAEMARKLAELVDAGKFDIMICDFLAPSMNFTAKLQGKSILFQHNVESMIWERHYKGQKSILQRMLFYWEWKKLLRYEKKTCHQFKKVVTVSKEDKEWHEVHFGLDGVIDTPTGVDIDYFRPIEQKEPVADLVFTGSMDWLPNEDAMVWFVGKIFPRILRTKPATKLWIVGRRPTAKIQKLHGGNIIVTGNVEDVRPYMVKAAVFIVPIRIGGGTRLKIFEAMAMGNTVVSTSIGAEGLPVEDGKHLFIADTEDEIASKVNLLLEKNDLKRQIGSTAREYVVENFGWGTVTSRFLQSIS